MTTILTRLVYVAELDRAATDLQLHAMLAAARVHNRRLDLTGLMVRSARHLVHVLEGRAAAIAAQMDWAGREPLHRDVRIVACAPLLQRRFDNWSAAIVRRYDLAKDISQLHQTGGLGELVPDQVLDRLVEGSADDLVLRMRARRPGVDTQEQERPFAPRVGSQPERRLR